jgi:hypothetical protein
VIPMPDLTKSHGFLPISADLTAMRLLLRARRPPRRLLSVSSDPGMSHLPRPSCGLHGTGTI